MGQMGQMGQMGRWGRWGRWDRWDRWDKAHITSLRPVSKLYLINCFTLFFTLLLKHIALYCACFILLHIDINRLLTKH